MSKTALSEPQPEPPTEHPSGIFDLAPGLPSPADPPPVEAMPDDADLVADPAALAALLTGSGDLYTVAQAMVEAGASAVDVAAAVERTAAYALALTELMTAVQDVVAARDPHALARARQDLYSANARLAQLEQGRD